MKEGLKIAVFIDFDNIEIGVKSTLQREFDVAAVLDALKERGEVVTKIAYANWGRQENSTRQLAEHAVQMVQRDPSPRGDKNGADINLALDALEMAFTHHHINAFAVVSGDSDFIALVNKLKQYNKMVFVVGGRAFTSTILQRNCHEFIAYESMLDEAAGGAGGGGSAPAASSSGGGQRRREQDGRPRREDKPHGGGKEQRRPAPLELSQAMPLVERALQVLERREVRPQLGLLKSTMLQLDSTFNEKAYGCGSFSDFVEKLSKTGLVNVTGGEGRYMITRKSLTEAEKGKRPDEALPILRDLLETHRIEMDEGQTADHVAEWMQNEYPDFDYKQFGFQAFTELLNFAQDKSVVRVEPREENGLMVHLGAEFHPPAVPEPPVEVVPQEEEEDDGPQPIVPGQPTARGIIEEPELPPPPVKKRPRKKPAGAGDGTARTRRPRKKI
jgi:uncharacterized protein (TIGR00288 family)